MAAQRSPRDGDATQDKVLALPPDIAVGEGLQLVLASALRSLRFSTARAEPSGPEIIHRFRIGVRRLRSLLAIFRSALPEEDRRGLSRYLAGFAQRYGRVREWDVLLTETLPPLRAALPDESITSEIADSAGQARRSALPQFALEGEAAAIAAALETAAFLRQPLPDHEEIWSSNLRDFSSELIEKHHRRLRKWLKHLDLTDQAAFHSVRIKTKRLRYPIEMFSTLFDEGAVQPYLRRVIRVQSALGHLNDAQTARTLLGNLPLSGRAQALANGWLARDILASRERFPKIARALRRSAPFWAR
ncbi:MAG TPA: CHAD domain-containing protein [Stellaceae bacterium]|nr:CHAD domain-containing protein [Stellaceae bacterium]